MNLAPIGSEESEPSSSKNLKNHPTLHGDHFQQTQCRFTCFRLGTLEAGTPFGLAWRRQTSEFLLDELRQPTRWHRRFTSPGLNWHFDPFKILIVCVYSLSAMLFRVSGFGMT